MLIGVHTLFLVIHVCDETVVQSDVQHSLRVISSQLPITISQT